MRSQKYASSSFFTRCLFILQMIDFRSWYSRKAWEAIGCYYSLDISWYTTFIGITLDFLNYYNCNIEMAFIVSDFRRLRNLLGESMKEFTYRIRQTITKIKPSLKERELIDKFLHLLPSEFTPSMIWYGQSSFTQAFLNEEWLEDAS